MRNMGDNWATSYRNTRGIIAVVGLVIVLVFSLYLQFQNTQRHRVRTDTIMGTITQVTPLSVTSRYSGQHTYYTVQVQLSHEKAGPFILNRKPPAIGTRVPILVDVFDDGTYYYHFHLTDWFENIP